MKIELSSLLEVKTIISIISGIGFVLTTTWAISKNSTIAELQKKNEKDSIRWNTIQNKMNSQSIVALSTNIKEMKDSMNANFKILKVGQQFQAGKIDAVQRVMTTHIKESSKDKNEIIRMLEVLGPYLNSSKSIPPNACILLANEKKNWIPFRDTIRFTSLLQEVIK